MSTLYIDRKNAELKYRDRRLHLCIDGRIEQSLPLGLLQRVVITSSVSTDTGTLATLADAGISVAILHGRKSRRLATVNAPTTGDARRRLAQYAAHRDTKHRLTLVQAILARKLLGQYCWTRRLIKRRPDERYTLTNSLETLRALYQRIPDEDDIDTLRGLEGAASAALFRALKAVLPPSLEFRGRRRRPPPDPANAVLSLGYTLAYSLALDAACSAGLDPAVGYLHDPQAGRFSLAADLMEPLRPSVEAFAWELFRSRKLVLDHFSHRDGGCFLDKAGRRIFYAEWESRAPLYRRCLRRWVMQLIRYLEEGTA